MGLPYKRNSLLATDDPTKRGKRCRLLTTVEEAAFLSSSRDNLELIRYPLIMEWLQNPAFRIEAEGEPSQESGKGLAEREIRGPALPELHLEDYLFRNWGTGTSSSLTSLFTRTPPGEGFAQGSPA